MKTRLSLVLLTAVVFPAASPCLTAQEPVPPPKPKWETSAQAGLTVTSGNSETVVFGGGIQTARKWTKSDLAAGADVAYGTDRGNKNTEVYRGYGQYNQNLSERLYLGLRLEGLHDGVADVNYRVTVSPLIGYYFIKRDNLFLRAETGPSVIFERVAGIDDEYLVWRVAERLEWKINERAKLWQSVEVLPQVDDFENTLINYEVGIDTAITTKLGLQSKILGTFDNQPAAGRKESDFRWITGLSYKF